MVEESNHLIKLIRLWLTYIVLYLCLDMIQK